VFVDDFLATVELLNHGVWPSNGSLQNGEIFQHPSEFLPPSKFLQVTNRSF